MKEPRVLRPQGPARIIVALPMAAPGMAEVFQGRVDDIVYAIPPDPMLASGSWYEKLAIPTDEEAREILQRKDLVI